MPQEKKAVVGRDLSRRFLSANDADFKKAAADLRFELEASSLDLKDRGIDPMLGRLGTQSAPPGEIDALGEPKKVFLAVRGGTP